jgi:hypothetical protein
MAGVCQNIPWPTENQEVVAGEGGPSAEARVAAGMPTNALLHRSIRQIQIFTFHILTSPLSMKNPRPKPGILISNWSGILIPS